MTKKIGLLLTLALCLGLIIVYFYPAQQAKNVADFLNHDDFYTLKVQPIFDGKCVACHSCYNSPCQLNLSSFEGLSRGANKRNIYDFPKFKSENPTRLYVDAHSVADWRKLNFYNVSHVDNKENSIINYMIKGLPGIESGLQDNYDSETSRVCISNLTESERDKYNKTNPAGRMPYGLPPLTESETLVINEWLKDKSKPLNLETKENEILNHSIFQKQILKWEDLLNNDSIKSQITARYIYEHLFLAHIYFENQRNVFFRLVRSETNSGPIKELSTLFPFDKPKGKFFYRLRPVTNTITHKDHIPYLFSEIRFEKIKKDFINSKWPETPKSMPSYGRAGSNPFETFKSIPLKSRYNFLLMDAGFYVMNFIKGPVCRGQTALNVINDHFWVMFIDPEKDSMAMNRNLELKIAGNSEFPASERDDILPATDFRKRYWDSVGFKFADLKDKKIKLSLDHIWNGNETNTNALLTIYRHFDSAHVIRGLRGQTPKTIWVIDYQVLESIYYNLAAGYNVFGPILHQVNTRLYMEMSRLASEDMFLSFMPKDNRKSMRSSWNKPVPKNKESVAKSVVDIFIGDVEKKLTFDYPFFGDGVISDHKFQQKGSHRTETMNKKTETDHSHKKAQLEKSDSKTEFLNALVKNRFSSDQINSQDDYFNDEFEFRPQNKNLKDLNDLVAIDSKHIKYLPDLTLIKVSDLNQVYSLIHNKAHFNVSLMFLEEDLRDESSDSIDLIKGVVGSYPNLFINIASTDLKNFVLDLKSIDSESKSWTVIKKYGTSRSSSQFWDLHSWFSNKSFEQNSNESGILDLNRYMNL